MRLFIPSLKTKLRLLKRWEFGLFCEDRNASLMQALGDIDDNFDWYKPFDNKHEYLPDGAYRKAAMPKGTVLTVDRIYIRSGAKDYDSVTFRVDNCPDKGFNKKRFWAKLDDVNKFDIAVEE